MLDELRDEISYHEAGDFYEDDYDYY